MSSVLPDLTRPPLTMLTEEEQMFRETVRQYAEDTIAPRVMHMDEQARLDADLIPQLFELGLMGIEIPEAMGGAGASFFTAVLVVEELSRIDPSVGVFVDVQNTLVNNALLRYGNSEVQEKYLPSLASSTVGAYALSEAGSGSDAFALQTRAREDGDHWVLDGRKLWITNGGEAGLFIIFANVNPDAGYRGITAFLVERDLDRKSTRLNSSHVRISYAVFCLKKKMSYTKVSPADFFGLLRSSMYITPARGLSREAPIPELLLFDHPRCAGWTTCCIITPPTLA